jgi:hypothetical protein
MRLSKCPSIGEANGRGFGLQMAGNRIYMAFLEAILLHSASAVEILSTLGCLGQDPD